jgi:hypothetical protein
MNVGVPLTLELQRQEHVLRALRELLHLRDRALHPVFGRRQHDFGTETLEDRDALQTHRIRHHHHTPVLARRAHHRQSDAGIAGTRLDDDGLGPD